MSQCLVVHALREAIAQWLHCEQTNAAQSLCGVSAPALCAYCCLNTVAARLMPRLEPGVDISCELPGVPDDRADQVQEIDPLMGRIGEEFFAILFHRIINGHSFAWMASQGMGESECRSAAPPSTPGTPGCARRSASGCAGFARRASEPARSRRSRRGCGEAAAAARTSRRSARAGCGVYVGWGPSAPRDARCAEPDPCPPATRLLAAEP